MGKRVCLEDFLEQFSIGNDYWALAVMEVNVAGNRKVVKYTSRELAGRVLWGCASVLFKFSPRPLWGFRRSLLRAFGGKIGRDVHIYPSVIVTMPWNLEIGDQAAVGARAQLYALGRIHIGSRTTISQGAHLCAGTHDITRADRPLIKSSIVVGEDCWIAADAFVGPDVHIGSKTVAGARAVVMKDVPAGQIVVGNPARRLGASEGDY